MSPNIAEPAVLIAFMLAASVYLAFSLHARRRSGDRSRGSRAAMVAETAGLALALGFALYVAWVFLQP